MWGDIAIAFLLAFITAFVITPYTIRLAKKVGAVDIPNDRRVNKKPMPRLGGLAVIAGFLVSVIYLVISASIEGKINLLEDNLNIKLLGILGGMLVLGIVCYIDDNRETHRCEMRDARHLDAFCYEDDLFEQFHNEAFLDFVDPFELREAEEIAERKELQRLREIEKVRIVLSMMKPAQERRLYKFVIEGKSCREIAVEEGTYHSSVSKSIEAAKKNFKKFYENL